MLSRPNDKKVDGLVSVENETFAQRQQLQRKIEPKKVSKSQFPSLFCQLI